MNNEHIEQAYLSIKLFAEVRMGEEAKAGVSRPGPQDPCHMVYAIFLWLGIGTLLPWNMFITVIINSLFLPNFFLYL
jgi:hypothetical protein